MRHRALCPSWSTVSHVRRSNDAHHSREKDSRRSSGKKVEKRTLHEYEEDDRLVLEMAENFMSLVNKYGRKGVETLLSGRLR